MAGTCSTPRPRRRSSPPWYVSGDEPALAARLTEAASHVAQEYEWRRIGARLVELYRAWDSRRRSSLSSTG